MKEIKLDLGNSSYSVFIGPLGELNFAGKVAVVTNPKVAGLHLKTLLSKIKAPEVYTISVPDGEEYKNLSSVESILEQCFISRLDRKSTIISFGGGVISDMAGFAASIYERGIGYVGVPTTLLAAVDASVGGKTGVNNKFGKNLIGSFYQPSAVYIDTSFLATLDSREIAAGMAEAIKMAVMFDEGFFNELAKKSLSYDEIIAKCVSLKADVVSQDEKEAGLRAVLNYGHTFAHVIECEGGYSTHLHGEAVAIGMVMANTLACELGLLSADEAQKIKNALEAYNLPTSYKIKDTNAFYEAFFHDKKSMGGNIKFILTNGKIGSHIIKGDISKDIVIKVLSRFY